LGCDRWKTGCGECPNLLSYPSVRRDATAFNWRRKQNLFAQSRLNVAAPSRWMMQRVRESMLGACVAQSRVVPTGIDLSVFRPAERAAARERLDIPQDAKVLLFVANSARRNVYKDYGMLAASVEGLAGACKGQKVLFIALGDSAAGDLHADVEIRFVPHVKRSDEVARYYQAADVYVHAAAADTFPRAVLEALACGVPVVATDVGGIPEQIRSLNAGVQPDDATGIAVPAGDVEAMTRAMARLLTDDALRHTLGRNAAADARSRFDLETQADSYLSWYQTLTPAPQPLNEGSSAGTERAAAWAGARG
jgi:glycosyltransferase involved in cell wall biosynthesis